MTKNRYFGFIGHCDRCGVRLTYALVCEACELVLDGHQPMCGEDAIDNTRVVDRSGPSERAQAA